MRGPIRALLTKKTEAGLSTTLTHLDPAELGEGDVTVRVEWSTVNYKDALALSGRGEIIKRLPLVGGIDLAGTVESSDDTRFAPGDRVLVNGWDLSQTHHGGYAEKARVPANWLVPVPDAFSTRDAMAIGTAGYSAMLCVLALEQSGLTPDAGDVLVTGANGGVGSIAIALLSKLGYRVVASTGRVSEAEHLRALGAADVIDRNDLARPGPPLGPERWAGAVDAVGSHTLANVLAQTRYRGVVAACGLAQGLDLPTSMAPFILRGITLAGIDTVRAPRELRLAAWARLATDLALPKLAAATREIKLADVPDTVAHLLRGEVRGRLVVRIP
ncbi:Alcohol dehydrogenase [Cystobacter fuscus DSM 2262]|uniref:Alcohol dehydrogenase n=1 Tax=Cystobacter fuscus (strain ATCC 25194 / DSM 2262 / NBRC 100088 / M29) TaxID=1242864 RepID=S9PFC2_CYSF2|nr:MDR family oxidoreductase [Cystobacter fuscus]EPX61067.1 Alcohol dehydrogenase [Cystobacter fuscus DSM 2262]